MPGSVDESAADECAGTVAPPIFLNAARRLRLTLVDGAT
jgi:hypothetical protein